MPYSPTELEALVRKHAPDVAHQIVSAAERAVNEADVVAEVDHLLRQYGPTFGVTLQPERERTLIHGRADAVYNRLVIEYEPPNSLNPSNTHKNNQHAIGQIRQYLEDLERIDRRHIERLAGVVLDGGRYIFVRHRENHWSIDDPVPITEHSTERFLRYLLSLSTERAVTLQNLVRGFGEGSRILRQMVPALYTALLVTDNPKVQILFEQWQQQFRQVSGYDAVGGQLSAAELSRLYAVESPSIDIERLFFAVHTYYATFIKLLALQVAHYYLAPKLGTGLSAVATYDTTRLHTYLTGMEDGGLFAILGIRNFLEGDFFGWYLAIWNSQLDEALRGLIAELSQYSLVTLDVDPEETRDLLKHLYQDLMPKKLRHALGEYYTPDWLAEHLLNQLQYDGDPMRRLLDPACGSGTFLVLAIKRIRRFADEHLIPASTVLNQVLINVVGFDLNPLAVITARTNYLLALGDLVQNRGGDISLPVYLADSIRTPSQGTDLYTHHLYGFNTAVGPFAVPRSLVDARYIDQFADLLEESVHNSLTAEGFKTRLTATFLPYALTNEAEVDVATQLYIRLLELERRGINGIWARIIKNAFAPLFQGQFDYVAGNPPWVNWESLPAEYRKETKPLWIQHHLFPHTGMEAILGKGKKDISMLMTFVAADAYLKASGKLGFIITESVLKTAGAGDGFRRFMLGSGVPVAAIGVDDMVQIHPFQDASNRTVVLLMQRGESTKYPVRYDVWSKAASGQRIAEDASLDEAMALCRVREFVAQPINVTDPTSPWITGQTDALHAIKHVLGKSDYQAKAGACTWLNGVYWMSVTEELPDGKLLIRNHTDGAKRAVETVDAVIEPDLLYPLLRGGDVKRWLSVSQVYILMVQDAQKHRGYDERWLQETHPKTYAYLKRFEVQLRSRSGYRRYFSPSDPFYSMFDVGDYTFAAHKVVWGRIASRMEACVPPARGDKALVPQETISMIRCDTSHEAHYICAALNSSLFDLAVQSHSPRGGKSFGTPHILENVRVPRFDPQNQVHRYLADLSQQAHTATAENDMDLLRVIEAEIDRQAANLWGLSPAELKEIQESLAELG